MLCRNNLRETPPVAAQLGDTRNAYTNLETALTKPTTVTSDQFRRCGYKVVPTKNAPNA